MAKAIILPRQGLSVESCLITKWHKKVGDTVKLGEPLFTYETDKATFDEDAKAEGTLLAIFAEEGDDVPCLQNVCVIGEVGEEFASFAPSKGKAKEEKAEEAVLQVAPKAEEKQAAPAVTGEIKASPRARQLADKANVDVRYAVPTGPNGRIIAQDVQTLLNSGVKVTAAAGAFNPDAGMVGTGIGGRVLTSDLQKPAAAVATAAATQAPVMAVEEVKMTGIRKAISKAMMQSLSAMAQLTLNTSFDATEIMALRKRFKDSGETMGLSGVTPNDMILYAVSRTLKDFRDLNAHCLDDKMLLFKDVNLGVAVDTDRGLMVPTIFAANQKSLAQISAEAKAAITACQKGSISPDQLKGGTFTITNLGSLGVESFTPVINPPQTAILGVCAIVDKVREVGSELKLYKAMGLSLTIDHRAVDGAPAARFLQALKQNLENFSLLLCR